MPRCSGLALIKGMQRKGLEYENGTIMDPRDGTVYRALMRLSPDNKHLEVRGFLGFALLGRSQIWNRLPDNALDPQPAIRSAPKNSSKSKNARPSADRALSRVIRARARRRHRPRCRTPACCRWRSRRAP